MKPAILGIAGTSLTPDERVLLREHMPLGVILFSRNIDNPAQLIDLNSEIAEILGPDGIRMVDQEGGRVARLRPPHWPGLPAAGALKTRPQAYEHGRILGQMARAAGFNMCAAPVLDIAVPGAHGVIGDRAFAGTSSWAGHMGRRLAKGIMDEGVTPVAKHIPGHGRALADSHLALPRVPVNDVYDHLPFMMNRHLPWAMTAHIVYEQWDSELPATISPVVIERIIRGMIGFTGKLMSDDLAMQALTGTAAERALAALAAGCDAALYCPGDFAGNRLILEAL